MTTNELTQERVRRRRVWLLVAVAAAVAAILYAAMASGLLGSGGDAEPPRARAEPSSTASASESPSSVPAQTEPLTMPESEPVRLFIPSIQVDSELMDLGLQKDGTLEVPPGAFPAGWFKGAPTPGELGPAIIVGHVRFETPGVFARLTELRPDDAINVARKDGSTARFVVTRVEHFEKSRFPTNKVYGNIDHAGLRLITCGGLDANTNKFDENVVVFAELAPEA
ncbi:MAG: class F sortase [Nocardioides sp.]